MAKQANQFDPPSIAHEDIPEFRQTNETDTRLWQRRCAWVRTCARCGQYHGQLHNQSSGVASIPVHIECQCVDNIIEPGETTRGYPTHDVVIESATPAQQQRYMGKGNFQLWQNESVKFEDIVRKRSIRPLHQVTARLNPPKGLLDGVPRDKRVDVLSDWFKNEHGLSSGLDTRAAVSRLNFQDMATVVQREFDSVMTDFVLTESELTDLLGNELAKNVFRGEVALSVGVADTVGQAAATELLSGRITIEQALQAGEEAI